MILALEPGLGKTRAALVMLLNMLMENPSKKHLIIAPKSLYEQWKSELNKLCTGLGDWLIRQINSMTDFSALDGGKIYITSHDCYRLILNPLKGTQASFDGSSSFSQPS